MTHPLEPAPTHEPTGCAPVQGSAERGCVTKVGAPATETTGSPAAVPPAGRWCAKLELDFALREGGGTQLLRNRHRGPLRVQRAFHPQADGTCHVYVLHPPGGVVGGDQLAVHLNLAAGTRALLTAPSASKFYRSAGPTAEQSLNAVVARDGLLEWLPQETIAFDGARVRQSTRVELEKGARYAGWEVLCLGRPAARETFSHGAVRTEFELVCEDRLVRLDRLRFEGGASFLQHPVGLGGAPVFGTFVVAPASAAWCEVARATHPELADRVAVTYVNGCLVVRYLGPCTAEAHRAFRAIWHALRGEYARSPAVAPRIWKV